MPHLLLFFLPHEAKSILSQQYFYYPVGDLLFLVVFCEITAGQKIKRILRDRAWRTIYSSDSSSTIVLVVEEEEEEEEEDRLHFES